MRVQSGQVSLSDHVTIMYWGRCSTLWGVSRQNGVGRWGGWGVIWITHPSKPPNNQHMKRCNGMIWPQVISHSMNEPNPVGWFCVTGLKNWNCSRKPMPRSNFKNKNAWHNEKIKTYQAFYYCFEQYNGHQTTYKPCDYTEHKCDDEAHHGGCSISDEDRPKHKGKDWEVEKSQMSTQLQKVIASRHHIINVTSVGEYWGW